MSAYRGWFEEKSSAALEDAALRAALEDAAGRKLAARAAAVGELEHFQGLRDLAARIKQHTLDNLDQYLRRFTRNVEANGGVVHFAETADQANAHVTRIARDNGLRLCVKAKSMTTEEIGLTAALQAVGLRVVETDLGEWIVQLDDDRPSHIVTPIIHKNRKAIAEAIARELGTEYTEDPETLTAHARRHFRDIFRRCDLGISGVNFAVADTGTICICTNEGNGRLTITRSKVHVAVMGVEKLIPRMADLSVFLKLLARSGTGQPITVYTSLITGPRRSDDAQGPEQLHVVLLDAGRRRIRSTEYSPVLRCIRCGACLNVCPVYRRIGGHAYDNVYPGPIGQLLAPMLNDFDRYADLPQASSLCGRCAEVCPVNIDIPDLLVRLRRDQVARKTVGWKRRLAFRVALAMLSSPGLYRVGQWAARKLSFPFSQDDWIGRLPWPVGDWTRYRALRRPARRSFRRIWKEELSAEEVT